MENGSPKVEFTVKELVEHLNLKIDGLDRKVDTMMLSINEINTHGTPHVQKVTQDFAALEERVRHVESAQVGAERLQKFQDQLDENRAKAHIGLFGIGVTFLAGAVDIVLRLIRK